MKRVRYLCLVRFFVLKILKTAYHTARPRFHNNNHNTSQRWSLRGRPWPRNLKVRENAQSSGRRHHHFLVN